MASLSMVFLCLNCLLMDFKLEEEEAAVEEEVGTETGTKIGKG